MKSHNNDHRLAIVNRPKRRAAGRGQKGGSKQSKINKPGCGGPLVLIGSDGLPMPLAAYQLTGEEVS